MVINLIPEWLPLFSLFVSLVTFVVCLVMLLRATSSIERLKWVGFLVGSIILVGGTAFQLNLIGLPVWIIIGLGGRLFFLSITVALASHDAASEIKTEG